MCVSICSACWRAIAASVASSFYFTKLAFLTQNFELLPEIVQAYRKQKNIVVWDFPNLSRVRPTVAPNFLANYRDIHSFVNPAYCFVASIASIVAYRVPRHETVAMQIQLSSVIKRLSYDCTQLSTSILNVYVLFNKANQIQTEFF